MSVMYSHWHRVAITEINIIFITVIGTPPFGEHLGLDWLKLQLIE